MKQPDDTTRMIGRNGVAATVILYNSPPGCAANLNTYRNQVQKLYIIDNSPTPTDWVMVNYKNDQAVIYQHFPQNFGIATALNTAAQLAISDGFTYLLTMDDDSQAPIDLVNNMLTYLATVDAKSIGIVSPRHVLSTAMNQAIKSLKATPVLTTMTSGNLLNLRVYEQVGPFRDDLFIDVVDHEFDLRLNQSGYQLIELPALQLTHRLGEQKRIYFTRLTYISHSPTRNYYLVRNSLVVAILYWQHYPFYLLTALLTIGIETAKAALFEDERLLRLQLIYKAITDGLWKRMGKLLTF